MASRYLTKEEQDMEDELVKTIHERVSEGLHMLEDIMTLMPEVANEHVKVITHLRVLKFCFEQESADLPKIDLLEPEFDGIKKCDEIIIMSQFLVKRGYSRNWQKAVTVQMEEFRAVLSSTSPGNQLLEITSIIHNLYYRLCRAFEMYKNKMDRDETFLSGERRHFHFQ
ncbi:unnamed protein product [Caenorhabditis sp. 36 PRJEB53466]|nr:unnamed protein product [Caenorhabditis sp. 36 PRJEB53466]